MHTQKHVFRYIYTLKLPRIVKKSKEKIVLKVAHWKNVSKKVAIY